MFVKEQLKKKKRKEKGPEQDIYADTHPDVSSPGEPQHATSHVTLWNFRKGREINVSVSASECVNAGGGGGKESITE